MRHDKPSGAINLDVVARARVSQLHSVSGTPFHGTTRCKCLGPAGGVHIASSRVRL